MLFYRRQSAIPEIGVGTAYAAVLRPGLRAYVVRAAGVHFDTELYPPLFQQIAPPASSKLSILLEGGLVLRTPGRAEGVLPVGGMRSHGAGWSERWEGSRFRVLVVEWEDALGAPLPGGDVVLRPRDQLRFQALADRLETGLESGPQAARWTAELLRALRSFGAPLANRTVADLDHDLPAPVIPIATAITRAMFDFRARPSWVDVESQLGRSERTLRRQTAGTAAWLAPLGWPHHWRAKMRALRMVTAVRLLGSRQATVEQVAAACGYGSARALLLALHRDGLPAPGLIRAFYRGQAIGTAAGPPP